MPILFENPDVPWWEGVRAAFCFKRLGCDPLSETARERINERLEKGLRAAGATQKQIEQAKVEQSRLAAMQMDDPDGLDNLKKWAIRIGIGVGLFAAAKLYLEYRRRQ